MLNEVALKSEGDPRLLLLAAQVSLYRGQYDAALKTFKQVESEPSLRSRALEGEGLALSLEGHSEDAVKALQAAVAADPTAWRAWNALGTEYDHRHDWQNADAAYEHALTASPNNPLVLNNRGFSRLTQNRLDDATADFVAALDKKPDFAPARNNLRLAIAMKGDYHRAVSGVNAADRAAVLNNAGFVAMLRGDYSAAKDLLGQAMKAKGQYYAMAAANLEATNGLDGGPSNPHGKSDAAR
jgi:Flp pilus assembly protein TadD